MNPAFLALSAANPGLLPMAMSGGARGGLRHTSRPVRWETDDETLTRVQRAWAVRERDRMEAEALEAWKAEPGNDVIYQRQLKTLNRINTERIEAQRKEEAERAEGLRARQQEALIRFRYQLATTRFVWTGVAVLVAVVIEAMGAPLLGALAVFGGLMVLLAWFDNTSRKEYTPPWDDDWDFFRGSGSIRYIHATPRVTGANWCFDELDELEPAQ